MANISIPIPDTFQDEFIARLTHASIGVIATAKKKEENFGKEWLKQKKVCEYLDISYGTLQLWRTKGLQCSVVEGITLISKTEINRFLKLHQV